MSRFRWPRRRADRVSAEVTSASPPNAVDTDDRMAAYTRVLGSRPAAEQVAILVDAEHVDAARSDEPLPVPVELFDGARVTVIAVGVGGGQAGPEAASVTHRARTTSEAHLVLAGLGPFDVLVDHGPPAKSEKRRRVQWLLGHVRPGGIYIVDDVAAAYDPRNDDVVGVNVVQFVLWLAEYALTHDGAEAAPPGGLDESLAATLETVELSRPLLVLQRRDEVCVKVRHTELEQILARRPGSSWSRVVSGEAKMEYRSRAVGYTNNPELRTRRYPALVSVPELLVREYRDVLIMPGGVAWRENLILPDTFRLWSAAMQQNTQLVDTSHYFARSPDLVEEPGRLSGSYYYADLEFPGHFGHFMTEGLGRLWAWPEAKRADPELKLVLSSLEPFQEEILAAYGIPRDEIVVIGDDARVDVLIAAMPGFTIGKYVSAEMRETYRRIQRGVTVVSGPGHERIFLTREAGLWRECVNAAAVEAVFAERGFAILRPEQHTVAEQAAFFREAKVVAGFAGSQLYGQVFSRPGLDIISFVGETYTSTNEYLLATALGHTLHQFWCPVRPGTRPFDSRGREMIGMHTDYEFDFSRDGSALSDLLDRLA